MTTEEKGIYKRDDVPFLDVLTEYKEALTKEFLAFHTDWYNMEKPLDNVVLTRPGGNNAVKSILSSVDSWKMSWLRYEASPGGKSMHNNVMSKHFPTAFKIMEDLKGQIGNVTYSILEANAVINRHTGPENRSGEYLRIHIPLIVPEGDIFLEVNGEEVTWDEPFGFNNQLTHSAYNYSNQRRLVFLIDIQRTFLGLTPGIPYSRKAERTAKPFVRQPKT